VQHTIEQPVSVQGVGLHTGQPVGVELLPASQDTGLLFSRSDRPGKVRTQIDAIHSTELATSIGNGAWRIGTVEHLLAALCGMGIDNAEIRVDGDEVPVLDGSAREWVRLLVRAGRQAQAAPRRVLVIERTVEVHLGPRRARLSPCERLEIAACIRFPHPQIGEQRYDVALENGSFRREIAWARTFGFERDVEGLRARGLIQGGSLENAVVYGPEGVLNPEGLRHPDEPVRHKILDMMGDLALIGAAVRGRFEAELPGHTLTRALLTEVLRQGAGRVVAEYAPAA